MAVPNPPANASGFTRHALAHPYVASGALALLGLWGATAWTDSKALLAVVFVAGAVLGWRSFGPNGAARRKLAEDPGAGARFFTFLAAHRVVICLGAGAVAAGIETLLFVFDERTYSIARVVAVSVAAGVLTFGFAFALTAFVLRRRPTD